MNRAAEEKENQKDYADEDEEERPKKNTGKRKKNIIIVGGGIIGCTTAYYLTRHPSYNPSEHTIHLIEANGIACAASGKAGGLLARWAYPSSIVPLSFRLHRELAEEHGGVERWGYRSLRCGEMAFEARSANGEEDREGEREGADKGVHGGAERGERKKGEKKKGRGRRGVEVPDDLDWVLESSVQSYEAMGTVEDTAQVHPYHFTVAMAQLAEERGVKIVMGRVTAVNYRDDDDDGDDDDNQDGARRVESVTYISTLEDTSSTPATTTTATAAKETTLPATDIILALGPWTRSLLPTAPISSTRAHSITLQPQRPCSAHAIFTQITLPNTAEPATPEIYPRPKIPNPAGNNNKTQTQPNNNPHQGAAEREEEEEQVYISGQTDDTVPLPRTSNDTVAVAVDDSKCHQIHTHVSAISHVLAAAKVTNRQACYLPLVVVPDNDSDHALPPRRRQHPPDPDPPPPIGPNGPLVGSTTASGLYLAAGHGCWGIQNGPGTGMLVAGLVFGSDGSTKE